jgi:hypothetical protein
MASTKRRCCCDVCYVQASSTFDCDEYDWTPAVVAAKTCTRPTGVPIGEWYTADLTNVGCTALYWDEIPTCLACDSITVTDLYPDAGTPSGIDTAECCDEDPGDPGEPPADGTPCSTDSGIYTLCTGFSIDHTCQTKYICDTSPPPPDVNTANGTARILNGTSGTNYAGFLHPNGMYLGSPVDWPRVTPGTGGTPSENLRRASLSWGAGDPNSCDDAFGGFGTLGSGMTVELDCSDPSFDLVRVRISFPYASNECTSTGYVFDSGWVSTSKSAGARKTVTVTDSAGSPNVFVTNGSVTVSYCCDGP